MDKDFCYLLRVRYAECDAQKVVFNGRYVDYIDVAMTEFTRVIWGDYNDVVAAGIDYQVVNVSVDWKAPAHFDNVLAITIKADHIGTTSFSLSVHFYSHDNTTLIASAKIVYVMVSTAQHIKTAIPDDMRLALEKGAPNVTIDHAGAGQTLNKQ